MNTPNLKWLRVRNWAVFVVAVPFSFAVAILLSPVIGVFIAVQIVDDNLKGGLK